MREVGNSKAFKRSAELVSTVKIFCCFDGCAEASATYTTARQPSDRQLLEQLWNDLTAARDDVTAALNLLPPSHRSRSLVLSAILKRHRAETRIGQNFIDDIQFYTNVIESTIDWLKTDSDGQWMTIYGHLLNSANFLTGEQSLCNAFNSLVCFSHRERLFYVNYTFTGEATFRLYRRAYNSADNIDVGVLEKTLSDHAAIFPALARCRRDVVQDINYYSVSPEHHTICDQSRRNASRVREVNDLLVQEMDIMIKRAVEQTKIGVSTAYTRYVIISWLLAIVACYGLAVVSLNVGSLICHSIRQNRRRKELEFQALCVDDSCCKELHKRGMEKAHVSGTLPEDTKRLNGNGYAVLLPSVVTNSYCTSARSNGPIHVATPTIDCLLLDSKYATKSEDNNDFVHNCHIKIATV